MHAWNRYNTESVFVLEHAGTPNPSVNVVCQAVEHTRSNHIRPTQLLAIHEGYTSATVQSSFVPFRVYLHTCMYLVSCVHWMDENSNSVHKAHNQ